MRRALLLACVLSSCGRCGTAPRPDAAPAATRQRAPTPSSGCARAPLGGDARQIVLKVGDVDRRYWLVPPRDETPNDPRPLVLAFHGSGADGASLRAALDLAKSDARAIHVYPDGLADHGLAAWNLTAGGRDVAFVDAILRDVEASSCVDENAVFAVGFSYGGWMANALACDRPNVFRGIASIEGGGPNVPCDARVSAMIVHGSGDFDEPLGSGEASRDHWLEAGRCARRATPSAIAPCVEHACEGGDRVLFCRHEGGHVIPDFAPSAVSSFFESLVR